MSALIWHPFPMIELKLLQSVQPAMLLPLYHQAIQADIALKNRDHYRQAVRS